MHQHADTHGPDHGSWLEAITLFQSVRDGDHQSAARLLRSAADPRALTWSLSRLLGVYLRGEDATKLDRFIAAAHRAPAPPPLSAGPSLPPLT